jgi:hypothetical protein
MCSRCDRLMLIGRILTHALKVLTNEKRGGLKVVAFDRSPLQLFTLRFSNKSVQADASMKQSERKRPLCIWTSPDFFIPCFRFWMIFSILNSTVLGQNDPDVVTVRKWNVSKFQRSELWYLMKTSWIFTVAVACKCIKVFCGYFANINEF